jgi:hypothetical protein
MHGFHESIRKNDVFQRLSSFQLLYRLHGLRESSNYNKMETGFLAGLDKTRVVFKNKTSPVGFLGFFAQKRGFLGFFSVSQILLGAS